MKRILIVLSIAALILCGCCKKETKEMQQRFVLEYKQTLDGLGGLRIIRDMETGKAYLFVYSGYAGGLTILEDGET